MADFKTHISTSTALGVGYGVAGHFVFGFPLAASTLAGGMCAVAGMLPDLDSDSGKPLREMICFTAAVVPMFLVHRFEHMGMGAESIVLAGMLIYIFIRYAVAAGLRRYTVHRGMFHSVPAAIIAAELGFLLCTCSQMDIRFFKAGAVLLGFMSHLVLDEIYAIEWKGGRWRFKRSFGTAIKLWGKSGWANASTYLKLILLTALLLQDPTVFLRFATTSYHGHPVEDHHHQDHGTHDQGTQDHGDPAHEHAADAPSPAGDVSHNAEGSFLPNRSRIAEQPSSTSRQ